MASDALSLQRAAGRSFRTSSNASGFTLMELLVVLGILATISAMAAPQLMSLMRENTVFEQADRVREVFGDARRFAIDTGIDYEFRYEPGGPMIVVLPTENELNVDSEGNSNTTEKYMRLSLELPEEFRLQAAEGLDETSETLDAARFGQLDSGSLSRRSWSAPIIFRFDGTAQDFELRVADKSGLTANISLRGLTAACRLSQVYQEDR